MGVILQVLGLASGLVLLPTTRQVMDRYIEAIGGRNAIMAHHSMTVRTKLHIPDKGVADQVTYYKGTSSREILTLPDGQYYTSTYDGSIAWEQSSRDSAPSLLKGDEIRSRARDADMYYPAHILDYFDTFDVVDVTTFEGHTCYHLKGNNKWGRLNEQYYDTKTGLLVGYQFNSAWRGGPGLEHQIFSDYKAFDGWLIPTHAVNKAGGREITQVVTAVTFDDVADSVFVRPASLGPNR
jgi:hypothetical protein